MAGHNFVGRSGTSNFEAMVKIAWGRFFHTAHAGRLYEYAVTAASGETVRKWNHRFTQIERIY